jgi:hypothetical protein
VSYGQVLGDLSIDQPLIGLEQNPRSLPLLHRYSSPHHGLEPCALLIAQVDHESLLHDDYGARLGTDGKADPSEPAPGGWAVPSNPPSARAAPASDPAI